MRPLSPPKHATKPPQVRLFTPRIILSCLAILGVSAAASSAPVLEGEEANSAAAATATRTPDKDIEAWRTVGRQLFSSRANRRASDGTAANRTNQSRAGRQNAASAGPTGLNRPLLAGASDVPWAPFAETWDETIAGQTAQQLGQDLNRRSNPQLGITAWYDQYGFEDPDHLKLLDDAGRINLAGATDLDVDETSRPGDDPMNRVRRMRRNMQRDGYNRRRGAGDMTPAEIEAHRASRRAEARAEKQSGVTRTQNLFPSPGEGDRDAGSDTRSDQQRGRRLGPLDVSVTAPPIFDNMTGDGTGAFSPEGYMPRYSLGGQIGGLGGVQPDDADDVYDDYTRAHRRTDRHRKAARAVSRFDRDEVHAERLGTGRRATDPRADTTLNPSVGVPTDPPKTYERRVQELRLRESRSRSALGAYPKARRLTRARRSSSSGR